MSAEAKKYTGVEIKNLDTGEVEITAEIPVEVLETHRTKALRNLQNTVNLQGFRKGHIPEGVLVKTVGEYGVLEEIANLALRDAYPHIILDNNVDAIGRPEIAVTKLAPGNPLAFKAKTSVLPKLELPDYKAIAQKVLKTPESITPTDKEIDDAIERLRRSVAWNKLQQSDSQKEENTIRPEDIKNEDLPELTDDFVKDVSPDFKDVADFKQKLTEQMQNEKILRAKEKKRVEIADTLIEDTKGTLPGIITDSEVDKMMAQFKGEVSRANIKWDDYLKHAKKTEEDLRTEWRPEAEKRAKMQLVLNEIAKKEDIKAPEEEIEKNVKALLEHNKDASPESARVYVSTLLANDKVFEFLEEKK